MTMITPRIPSGTLELLPEDQVHFLAMLDTIRQGFEAYGFDNIETPNIENTEVLLSKSGGETEKQVYFVQSTGSLEQGNKPDIALHFDLTIPLARYVAQYERMLPFPFKRYQIQRVYRGERAQKGRFREFYQCDIDIIGRETLHTRYDAEILNVIQRVFLDLGLKRFTIYVNNRKLLKGLFEAFDIHSDEQQMLILREIDKADKIGFEAVAQNLSTLNLMSPEAAAKLLSILNNDLSQMTNADVLSKCESLGIATPLFAEGLSEIKDLINHVEKLPLPDGKEIVRINLAIARGLDYYTGMVYETVLDDYPQIGSVCSGGRYENLVNQFSRQSFPGVGISIGATRLFYQLKEAGFYNDTARKSFVDYMVLPQDESVLPYARLVAQTIRGSGKNVDLYLEAHPLKKQMKYADKRAVPMIIIVGPEEMGEDKVFCKNMLTGVQDRVSLKSLLGD